VLMQRLAHVVQHRTQAISDSDGPPIGRIPKVNVPVSLFWPAATSGQQTRPSNSMQMSLHAVRQPAVLRPRGPLRPSHATFTWRTILSPPHGGVPFAASTLPSLSTGREYLKSLQLMDGPARPGDPWQSCHQRFAGPAVWLLTRCCATAPARHRLADVMTQLLFAGLRRRAGCDPPAAGAAQPDTCSDRVAKAPSAASAVTR